MNKFFLALSALILTTIQSHGDAFAGEGAIVSFMQGEATIQSGGTSSPAQLGSVINAGDTVQTSDGCTVDVAMSEQAGCRLLASSEAVIAGTTHDAMQVRVLRGNAIVNVDKLRAGSTFSLETPTAIASVRGTQFWGRVDMNDPANAVTTFAVREGAVEVFAKASQTTYTLQVGQALDIPQAGGAALPQVRTALPEEMAAMEQASSIKTSA